MIKRNNAYIWFVVPAVTLFVVIVLLPTLYTVLFSVTEWRRFRVTGFGTFDHYVRAFSDPTLLKAFVHNFIYILCTIFLEAFMGLVLAGIANHLPHSIFYRSLFFSPLILPSIVVGVLWQQVYAYESGLLNAFLGLFGASPVAWLGAPFTMISVSVVSGWLFSGFFMTIFYAGLSRVPQTVLEAAVLEGASSFKIFLRIEIPLIRNLIMLALLIVTTGGFKGFDLFQIMLRRDPLESGIVMPVYLVRVFFENQDIGYGSAISMILTVVVVAIMLIINFVNRRFVGQVEEY